MPLRYSLKEGQVPFHVEMLDCLAKDEEYTDPFTDKKVTKAEMVEVAKHYIKLLEEYHEKASNAAWALHKALADIDRLV